MSITIFVVVVYLTNGTPLPNFFVVDDSKSTCGNDLALEYTRRFIVPSLAPDSLIQSPEKTMLYVCLPVPPGPGPGPAAEHVPQDDEA